MEDLIMSLTKLSNNYFPGFPSFLDKFFEGDQMDWNNWNFAEKNSTLPAINVLENEDEFKIEVAAPGMRKEDFAINYENGRLNISSEKKEEKKSEKEKISRCEFSYQSFQRSFTVAESSIEVDKIAAKYEDGILRLVLPKREEVKPKPSRMIQIK